MRLQIEKLAPVAAGARTKLAPRAAHVFCVVTRAMAYGVLYTHRCERRCDVQCTSYFGNEWDLTEIGGLVGTFV